MKKILKKLVLKPVKGKGFVGLWNTGELGWGMPNHIQKKGISTPHIENRPYLKGHKFYLCEITIKPLKSKNGRYITKNL
jgi:hypothetical protein